MGRVELVDLNRRFRKPGQNVQFAAQGFDNLSQR